MIKDFIKNFVSQSAEIEFESGKKVCLKDACNIEINENSVLAQIENYKAEFCIDLKEENVYSFKAKLVPSGEICDKAHKITEFKIASPYDKKTFMLINHSAKEGITSVQNLPADCRLRDFCSYYQADNTQNAVTITTKLPAKFRSDISVNKNDKEFTIEVSTTIPYTYQGEIICQEWMLYFNMPTTEALAKNADRFSLKQEFQNPIGWSTWDYYFTSATEDDVKENVDFIANDEVLSKKVRYIALDDGWQQREGDWKSGIRYPGGLKNLVDYIKNKGFEAGIWIAPTRLHFLCGTVMRRHDFLVRDQYGDPIMDEDMYVLDPTHPDGEKYLRETFAYLAECGFTFYKLDFISNMLNFAQRFHDTTAGPFDALLKLFEIVRDTVPKGSHIMGCSLPYGMGTGVADSRRTGWDIHNVWTHIKACVGTYIPQFASNGKIFRNDLDYLVVRGKDTTEDNQTNVLSPKEGYNKAHPSDDFVWRAGEDFDYREAKTWCTVMLMSGSSIFMGDNLPLLNKKGLELVRKTVSAADFCAATPVFGSEKLPEIWYKKELNKVYVFNFSEEEKEYSINLQKLSLPNDTYADIFSKEEYKPEKDILKLSLLPHDSVCLELK